MVQVEGPQIPQMEKQYFVGDMGPGEVKNFIVPMAGFSVDKLQGCSSRSFVTTWRLGYNLGYFADPVYAIVNMKVDENQALSDQSSTEQTTTTTEDSSSLLSSAMQGASIEEGGMIHGASMEEG